VLVRNVSGIPVTGSGTIFLSDGRRLPMPEAATKGVRHSAAGKKRQQMARSRGVGFIVGGTIVEDAGGGVMVSDINDRDG
jgi:hypothetical protein